MHLIITEKNISGRRIAGILSGNKKVSQKKDAGVSSYHYDDKVVVGLRGHVVEVDFKPGYTNWRSKEHPPRSLIDAHTIKVPTEKKIVRMVQKLARTADLVTIATDFDTEGELIGKEAYDLIHAANPSVPVDRARFSAITPDEIRKAFSSTTGIDFDLAAAGEARQVIDLIWGASLTRFISLAARRGGQNILSVGRVQSPTLAMIVDREKEIESFIPEPYWQLHLRTEKNGECVVARHTTQRFTEQEAAEQARDNTREPLIVTSIRTGTRSDRAPPPFDTTSFIVAAARLGFSAANAMRIAEELYMNGYISYPRTDNTVYPDTLDLNGILKTIRKTEFAKDVEWVMANRRSQPTRGKKSSTDHPPIHPTGAASRDGLGKDRWQIYELVLRRFLATLSPDARWNTMKVLFAAGGEPYTATGGQLLEPGWRRVYPYSQAKEQVLPAFTEGENLPIREVMLEKKETQPPPRYSQSKLIQQMEELGLGTKSTRHEVIGKLVSRKYVEGTPLRPTLVGRAVIDSLENHAETITKPDMTQTLENHMEEIRERRRTRDDVVTESREMLHAVFNDLEAHGEEIGAEIMEQTAEELILGPCPVCGADIRIRHLRNRSQFIGCTRYPDCTFNISLPMMLWGYAVRTDEVCPEHGLNHVRLVRRGARPWDIGCPLCHHIATNRETLRLIPSMNDRMLDRLTLNHIYTVYEVAKTNTDELATALDVSEKVAERITGEAEDVLSILRKRSECRKFIRKHLPPRRGRSHAKITKKLLSTGIEGIEDLEKADIGTLRGAGMGEQEAMSLRDEAKRIIGKRRLSEIGIPAVSLNKYLNAGITSPEDFPGMHPVYISHITGISLDTVNRHAKMVCHFLGIPEQERYSKKQVEKGKDELLSIPGIGDATLGKFYRAGIINGKSLMQADPKKAASLMGISPEKMIGYQKEYAKQAMD